MEQAMLLINITQFKKHYSIIPKDIIATMQGKLLELVEFQEAEQ